MTLPWIEKYRPQILDDIISQEHIIDTLKKCIQHNYLPHMIFYGPPGTGKTSTIMACTKELYGKYHQYMVMELNASDDRGIEVVRDKIKKFVNKQSLFYGKSIFERKNVFKIVILDEIDAMTDDAQAILRKIIEEFSSGTRFCLICNYIQKILPALQSRCSKFRFAPLLPNLLDNKINDICNAESLVITNLGVKTIIKHSKGDMRKVLNILQSCSMIYDLLNEENINNCLGYPQKNTMNIIYKYLLNESFEYAYKKIYKIKSNLGLGLSDIINEIHDHLLLYMINSCSNKILLKLHVNQVLFILDKIRSIEFNQSIVLSDDIQLSALISIFKLALNLKKIEN